MSQVIIQIVVSTKAGFTGLEAAAEVLFNAGIGNDVGEDKWMNNEGQAYFVQDWISIENGELLRHTLASKD